MCEVAPCDENGKPTGGYKFQLTDEKSKMRCLEIFLYPPWGSIRVVHVNEYADLPSDPTEDAAGKGRECFLLSLILPLC